MGIRGGYVTARKITKGLLHVLFSDFPRIFMAIVSCKLILLPGEFRLLSKKLLVYKGLHDTDGKEAHVDALL